MSINRFLSLAIALIALIACSLATYSAISEYRHMSEINRAELRLAVLRAMSDIPRNLNGERGLSTLSMQNAAAGATIAGLADLRKGTRTAVETARRAVDAAAGLSDGPALARAITDIEKTYAAFTALVDERLARAPGERGDAVEKATGLSGQISGAVGGVIAGQLRELSHLDGEAYRWAATGAAALDLRDWGGRQAGFLQTLVAAHKTVSPADRVAFQTMQGRVDQIWGALKSLADDASTPERVKRAVATVEADYVVYFGGIKKDMLAHFDTGAFPLDGAGYRDRTVAMWAPVMALRDAALETAEEGVRAQENDAHFNFAVGCAALLATLAASALVMWQVSLRVTRPLTRMTDAIGALAAGDLAVAVPGTGRSDEIGRMAEAVDVFKASLVRNHQLEAETEAARRDAEADRRRAMAELAEMFEQAVGGVVEAVQVAADELQTSARTMTGSAAETSARSNTVAAAAEQASANVGVVAAAAEELSNSVHEIGQQVQRSATLSQGAVGKAQATAEVVAELSRSATTISDILGLISQIAGQTNLLALNATIEAARAGEAGRGFAVVASEVKNLAGQTAKATDDISRQVADIQESTGRAVGVIEEIGAVMREIGGVTSSIAAAMEQQGAVTRDIAGSVSQAAEGSIVLARSVSAVEDAITRTRTTAGDVDQVARVFGDRSQALASAVSSFLAALRSGPEEARRRA